jgi:hypothetical protein
MANSIEIVKLLNKVDMNVLPFLERALIPKKYDTIKNAITQAGLWGDEIAVAHYLGKREDDSVVHYLQIDFTDHDSLYVVVEQNELQ